MMRGLIALAVTVLYTSVSAADDKKKDDAPPVPPPVQFGRGSDLPARTIPTPGFREILADATRANVDRDTFARRTLPLGKLNSVELHAVREYLGSGFNNSKVEQGKVSDYFESGYKKPAPGAQPGADAETAGHRRILTSADPTIPRGTNYNEMNGLLRGTNKAPTDAVQRTYVGQVNNALDSAFNKSRLKAPLVTYRFTGDGAYLKPDAGGFLPPDKGYTSTARTPAPQFGGPGRVLIVYYLPEGTPALNMEAMLAKTGDAPLYEARIRAKGDQGATGFGRDEVLLPREMKSRVIATYTDASGQKVMHVQVVPNDGVMPKLPTELVGERPGALQLDPKYYEAGIKPGSCEKPSSPTLPGATPPRTGWTVAKGAPVALGSAVFGKLAEKVTGSSEIGAATSIGSGLAPAFLKGGLKGGLKAGVPVVIGGGVQYGVTKYTGSQQAGEVSGYLTSAGFGLSAGGPAGAIVAVGIHGTSNLLTAGIDVIDADLDSHAIDRRMVTGLHYMVFGKKPDRAAMSKYYGMTLDGKLRQQIKEAMASSPEADALIDEYFNRTIGRSPVSDEEREAARTLLRERGAAVLAYALEQTPHAAQHRANLAAAKAFVREIESVATAKRHQADAIAFHRAQYAQSFTTFNAYVDALKRTKAAPGTPEHDQIVWAIGEELKHMRTQEAVIDELAAHEYSLADGTTYHPKEREPWRDVRDLRDQAFMNYYQQASDRLMQGEWGQQLDAYTAGYGGIVDPFKRAAQTHGPFAAYSQQGKLERAFGRVGESPEEYARNATFWKGEKAAMLQRKEQGIPVTPTSYILESLGR